MSRFTCPQCQGEFYVDTAGMNCPNCKVWMEGEKFSPSPQPTQEPTDEERAIWTKEGAQLLSTYGPHNFQVMVDGSSGDIILECAVVDVMTKAFKLWQDRQRKYGRGNIARTGAMGCYIRAEDKMSRLRRVYIQGKGDMPDESINDTWLDLLNYAMMGYMCTNNLWPGLESADWYGETNAIPGTKK